MLDEEGAKLSTDHHLKACWIPGIKSSPDEGGKLGEDPHGDLRKFLTCSDVRLEKLILNGSPMKFPGVVV